MYKLTIDTTTRDFKKVELLRQEHSDYLLVDYMVGAFDVVQTIKTLLEKHSIALDQLVEVTANAGPGSFTGIKMGLAVVNILNWQLFNKKPGELLTPHYGKEPEIS